MKNTHLPTSPFPLRHVSFHPMNIFSVARQINLYIVSIELQLSYWPLREMAKESLLRSIKKNRYLSTGSKAPRRRRKGSFDLSRLCLRATWDSNSSKSCAIPSLGGNYVSPTRYSTTTFSCGPFAAGLKATYHYNTYGMSPLLSLCPFDAPGLVNDTIDSKLLHRKLTVLLFLAQKESMAVCYIYAMIHGCCLNCFCLNCFDCLPQK